LPSEEKSDVCHQKTEITVDEFLAKHDMIDMVAQIVHSEILTAAKTLKKKSARDGTAYPPAYFYYPCLYWPPIFSHF
jgi:hypothetical protein